MNLVLKKSKSRKTKHDSSPYAQENNNSSGKDKLKQRSDLANTKNSQTGFRATLRTYYVQIFASKTAVKIFKLH